jgi:hypothetical protein
MGLLKQCGQISGCGRGRCAAQSCQDRAGVLGVGVAGGDGLGDAAGAVDDVTGGKTADLPLRGDEFAQPLQLEGDVALGERQIAVTAGERGEQGGIGGAVGERFELTERLSEQRLDALGDDLGDGVSGGVGLGQSAGFQGRWVRTAPARPVAGAGGAVAVIFGWANCTRCTGR